MYQINRPNTTFLLVIIFLCLAGSIAMAVAPSISHAVQKHGEDAIVARSCRHDPDFLFYNDKTGRTAFVCAVLDGKFGIAVVDEAGEEVTAFIKNKMKSIEQVIQYLKNCGYKIIQ